MTGLIPLSDEDEAQVRALVEATWQTRKGAVLDRLDTLAQAARAAVDEQLDEPQRRHAEREAHRLAGSLGTFGRQRASQLAREAETLLTTMPAGASAPSRLAAIVADIRVLLVDDVTGSDATDGHPLLHVRHADPWAGTRIAEVAMSRGMRTRVSADTPEAGPGSIPRVAVVDLDLPGALELLRRLASEDPAVPTVALVGVHHGLRRRLAASEAGATTILPAESTAEQILVAVDAALGRSEPVDGHVVAVLDTSVVQDEVRGALEPAGLTVEVISDARELEQALEATKVADVLLIGSDLPELAASDLCRAVRSDPRWAALPIALLVPEVTHAVTRAAALAGADGVVAQPLDVIELRARTVGFIRRSQSLRALAETDRLTGLANRRKLDAELDRFVALADRLGQPLTLALIDLDRFKRVNDRYGHITGDLVLRRVAALLRDRFRGEDLVARWGGEELAIATFGMPRPASVRRITEALDELRDQRFDGPEGQSFKVTFSAGVAEYPEDATDLASLYQAADAALYRAKDTGRDRVAAAGAAPANATPGLFDVAIIEDDDILADLLRRSLDEQGLTHTTITDGHRAIRRLTGPGRQRARVVLLDIDLPGSDGLEVLDRLAADAVLEETRVIMLTARAGDTDVIDTLSRGAFDHVPKPFSVPVLLQRVLGALAA